MSLLKTKYTSEQLKKYHAENESISNQLLETKNKILQGDIKSRYIFGENVIDGLNNFEVEPNKITNKLNNEKFYLESTLPYKEFF
jgi:hypothetical protein